MRSILFVCLLSFIPFLPLQSAAASESDYYYANSYFSKDEAPRFTCPANAHTIKSSKGIMCERECSAGFTRVGTLCEPNIHKREVSGTKEVCTKWFGKLCLGTRTECIHHGWEGPMGIGGPASVCFSPCPANYVSVSVAGVRMCKFNKKSYSVISLKANPSCRNGFKLSATGCIEQCRRGYTSVSGSNFCFMNAPKGYASCGIGPIRSPGFAKGYVLGGFKISAPVVCEFILAAQVYTVESLASAVGEVACATCKAQREANKAALLATYADDLDTAEEIAPKLIKELDPLQKEIQHLVRSGAKGEKISKIEFLKLISVKALNAIIEPAKKAGSLTMKGGSHATKLPAFYKIATVSDPHSYEGQLEIVRNAATIISLFFAIPSLVSENPEADLVAATMDTIAAFAYPVYGK